MAGALWPQVSPTPASWGWCTQRLHCLTFPWSTRVWKRQTNFQTVFKPSVRLSFVPLKSQTRAPSILSLSDMDLSQLERELQRVRAQVDSWAARKQGESRDLRDQHESKMKEQSGKLQNLNTTKEQLLAAVDELNQRLAEEKHQVSSLQTVSSAMRNEQEVVKRQLAVLQEALHVQELECLRRESEVMVEENMKDKRVNALKMVYKLFSTRLGMEFKQKPGSELQIVMTQIDREEPERQFKVAVHIEADNSYTVTKCSPSVAKLPELVQQLNASNQFSSFIVGLRREFQALANKD